MALLLAFVVGWDVGTALAEGDRTQTVLVASNEHLGLAPPPSLNGWEYLAKLLLEKGIPERRVTDLLSDSRMPEREPVYFRVNPRESKVLYRKHNTARNRNYAKAFYEEQRAWFDLAEKRYGVPSSVIAVLLQVETSCGRHVGRERVFYRLARLATVAEPSNIAADVEEQRDRGEESDPQRVAARARVLENTFLPHVIDTIRLADSMGIHPLELYGSSGGAIGIPQFLPGNIERYGVDADGNGAIDVFHPADAILSTANFLSKSGWKGNLSLPAAKQRAALLNYNRSNAYADTILAMASKLRSEMYGSALKRKPRKR